MSTRYALLAAASLTVAAIAAGCQQSGGARASVDVDRPRMASERTTVRTEVDTSAYTTPYVVTTDTTTMASPGSTTSAGTLQRGDVVYLRSAPSGTGTVAARTSDGRVVYVRASDLRAQ